MIRSGWWIGLALPLAGCAASLQPVAPGAPAAARMPEESRVVRPREAMAEAPAIADGCYSYVALLDYTTPTAGATESMPIFKGTRYTACYEATEIGDYVFLTRAHHRSNVWLGIRRDGFVGEKGGWWSFLGREGPKDYRATRLFQGSWGRSKWTSERLMAREEARVVYQGHGEGPLRLAYEVGAPEAGLPFERRDTCSIDLAGSDVVSCAGFSFRILDAGGDAVRFVLLGKPALAPPESVSR
jgi:hypothetical protein